jgi:repressor LexA
MALTRRQREVLDVIRRFIDKQGYSPSLEEIGAELGLSSVATVHKHVTLLVEKGYVRRTWNQNRSIELTEPDSSGTFKLPLSGTIAAGQPLDAVPTDESICVRDGDFVVIEDRQAESQGETVVALIDGSDATLKRLYRDGRQVRLEPANPTMEPMVFPAERVRVQGVAVGVIRKY